MVLLLFWKAPTAFQMLSQSSLSRKLNCLEGLTRLKAAKVRRLDTIRRKGRPSLFAIDT